MTARAPRLTGWQVFLLVYTTSFCVTPFDFQPLHRDLGRFIWVACLAQLTVVALATLIAERLATRLAGRGIGEAARAAFGPWGGAAFLLLLAVYVFIWGPLGNLMTLVQMVNGFMLPLTSPLLLSAVAMASAGYGAYLGLAVVVRAVEVVGWIVLPATVLLTVIPYLTGVHVDRLLPLAGATLPIGPLFFAYALGLRGFVLPIALLGRLRKGPTLTHALWAGSLGAWVLVSLLVLLPHLIFAEAGLAGLPFPTLSALDTVNAAAFGLQSFLPITYAVWYMLSWTVLASSLAVAGHLVAEAVGAASRTVVAVLTAMGFAASALAGSLPVPAMFALLEIWSGLGYLACLGLPALLVARAGAVGRVLPRAGEA
jgi:hypothetical protein